MSASTTGNTNVETGEWEGDFPREKEITVDVTVREVYRDVSIWVYEGDTADDVRRRLGQDLSCGDMSFGSPYTGWIDDVEFPEGAFDFQTTEPLVGFPLPEEGV
jgi:hypothetical protein